MTVTSYREDKTESDYLIMSEAIVVLYGLEGLL
jgi:hypothetical protein